MTCTATGPAAECPWRGEGNGEPRARLFIDGDGDLCIEGRENNLVACVARDDHVGEWNVLNPDVIDEIIRLWNAPAAPLAPTPVDANQAANPVAKPAPPTVAEAARVILGASDTMPVAAKLAAVSATALREGKARPVTLIEAWRAALRALAGEGKP